MLTLKELLEKTPREVQKRSRLCTHRRLSWTQEEEYQEQTFRARCNTNLRTITLRFYEDMPGSGDGHIAITNPVWVHCDCPYWLYYCEVAVHSRGSTDILSSNGLNPVIRNPPMIPYLCKHLFRIGHRLRGRTQRLSPNRQKFPKRNRKRKLPKHLASAADRIGGPVVDPRTIAAMPDSFAADIVRDVLLQLLYSDATKEDITHELYGSLLPSELKAVLRQLSLGGAIRKKGQLIQMTPTGLAMLIKLL